MGLSCANNLTLNLTKTVEIVFVDSKRRRQVQPPSPLATISRVSSLKVLGITISSHVGKRTRFHSHQLVCEIHICPQDSPVTWHEQRSTSYDLHICYQ